MANKYTNAKIAADNTAEQLEPSYIACEKLIKCSITYNVCLNAFV